MSDGISIVVPVYNVPEKYLRACIESLINQTYKVIEIILVDDGSKDQSGMICDQYANLDSRIKVIHKQNGGLSAARNTGYNHSKYEWLMFVDGDDYVDNNFCYAMLNAAIQYDVDLVMCGMYKDYGKTREKYTYYIPANVSSMEMYGSFAEANNNVTETELGYINPLAVRSNYPESKRLCENMCVAFWSEYGVPVKIARLSQTFGAGILSGENRVFAQFARSAIEGKDIVLHTRGLSEGNYCYTRDTIMGLFLILIKGENAEAYNVTNPETHTTIVDMARMVCQKFGNGKIKVVFDIPESNQFGYAADTKMKLNADKLKNLGWRPEIGLEEAYRRMIMGMKREG